MRVLLSTYSLLSTFTEFLFYVKSFTYFRQRTMTNAVGMTYELEINPKPKE